MEMLQVLQRTLLGAAQMHPWTIDHLAKLPPSFQAVKEVERIPYIALFKDKFEIRVAIQQPTVDDPGNGNHVFKGMPQHPPDRLVHGKRSAFPPARTLARC